MLLKKYKSNQMFHNFRAFINPSRPNLGRREKIKLNLYFRTSLRCLKRFYEGLKGLQAPQRRMKIKI